jgi:hypothetical protein
LKSAETQFLFPVSAVFKIKNANEIQKEKEQKAPIQQHKSFAQGRPREGDRAVRQAGQYAAFESA